MRDPHLNKLAHTANAGAALEKARTEMLKEAQKQWAAESKQSDGDPIQQILQELKTLNAEVLALRMAAQASNEQIVRFNKKLDSWGDEGLRVT